MWLTPWWNCKSLEDEHGNVILKHSFSLLKKKKNCCEKMNSALLNASPEDDCVGSTRSAHKIWADPSALNTQRHCKVYRSFSSACQYILRFSKTYCVIQKLVAVQYDCNRSLFHQCVSDQGLHQGDLQCMYTDTDSIQIQVVDWDGTSLVNPHLTL